jgi:hypothetical protein
MIGGVMADRLSPFELAAKSAEIARDGSLERARHRDARSYDVRSGFTLPATALTPARRRQARVLANLSDPDREGTPVVFF